MNGVLSSLASDGVGGAVIHAFRSLRSELARRNSGSGAEPWDAIDRTLAEALSVLAREADNLKDAAIVGIKAAISRPALFAHPTASQWIATREAQQALQAAARLLLRGKSDAAPAAEARALYSDFLALDPDPEAPDPNEVYDAALLFLQRSLTRGLSLDTHLVLDAVAGLRDQLAALPTSGASELFDAQVARELDRIRRRRFFVSSDTRIATEALALALTEGRLAGASPAARGQALAWCARLLATADADLARRYIDMSAALTGDETEEQRVAKAFLLARGDMEAALARLDIGQSLLQTTAALQILRNGVARDALFERIGAADIRLADLDPDGRLVLLTVTLEAGRWSDARDLAEALTEADYEWSPALLWFAAATDVACSAPDDLRQLVIHDLPSGPSQFPLHEDSEAIEGRRRAEHRFRQLAAVCRGLDLSRESAAADRYATWLALRDPASHADAIRTLRRRVDDPEWRIAYLPLALDFGLEIDLGEAELAIRRAVARGAGDPPRIAAAITGLIFRVAEPDPGRAADYIGEYRDLLQNHLEAASLVSLEVRLLVLARRTDEARLCLESAGDIVTTELHQALLETIETSDNRPSIASLEALYAQNGQTPTLITLVRRYGEMGYSERYFELARRWVGATHSADDALEVIAHLGRHDRDKEALQFLAGLGSLVQASDRLLAHLAWLHFRCGHLAEAEAALAELEGRRSHQDDRTLRFRLLVTSGRWDELDDFVERRWQQRDELPPHELAMIASLAAHIDSKRAEDLVFASAERSPDDPNVLAAAYASAIDAGIEDRDATMAGWLSRAADLSGEDGPIQRMPISDLAEMEPDWDKRVESAHKELAAGNIPIAAAAAMLRRPWLELQLAPLLANRHVGDPRHRSAVPLFSGRQRSDAPIDAAIITLDRTAVMTLAALGLVEPVIEAHSEIWIAHDLLRDCFEEARRLKFHQPSQVRFGTELLKLLQQKRVLPFEASTIAGADLVSDIGHSLAQLLTEAKSRETGQYLVVHPFPIRRAGILFDDIIPLEDYAGNLASCSAVVDAMERAGLLLPSELRKVRAYFEPRDERWPREAPIERGATLYLSGLAVSYFRYAGLLGKIADAGITVVVPSTEIDTAEALRDIDSRGNELGLAIGALRAIIAKGIASGRVRLDAAIGREQERSMAETTASLVTTSGLFVCDDRFVNRYENFEHERGQSRIVSSLDLIEALAARGRIPAEQANEAATRLRSGGALFVPLKGDALAAAVAEAAVEGDAIRETAELRAVRENLRLAQLRGWFDPLADTPWLLNAQNALVTALMAQWRAPATTGEAAARSRWLLGLFGTQDWADSAVRPVALSLASHGIILDQLKLLLAAHEADPGYREAFEAWLERDVLEPAWESQPHLRKLLLDELASYVTSVVPDVDAGEDISEADRYRLVLGLLPDFVRQALLEDEDFAAAIDVEPAFNVHLSGDTIIDQDDFVGAIREYYAHPELTHHMADATGQLWELRAVTATTRPGIELAANGETRLLRDVFALLPSSEARLAGLDAALVKEGLAPRDMEGWRARLAEGPLPAILLQRFETDLAVSPGKIATLIEESIEKGEASISTLVPTDPLYFERLTGHGEAGSREAYAREIVPAHLAALGNLGALEAAKRALLLASQPEILAQGFPELSTGEWNKLGAWVRSKGDLLARIGFLEVAMGHAPAGSKLEGQVIAIAKDIEALDPQDPAGRITYFSSLFQLVDGELSRRGTLAGWPPFRRRIAAMAQTAFIERLTFDRVDAAPFAEFCARQRGWRFFVQGLADLRQEPRWRPDFMVAPQLRNELIGRIINRAGLAKEQGALTPAIEKLLVGDNDSVAARMAYPMVFWPGPIEGAVAPGQRAPAELLAMLDKNLAAGKLTKEALTIMVNIEPMGGLPPETLDRAAELIVAAGPRLLSLAPADRLQIHLLGLAYLAAQNRRADLADHLQAIARFQRKVNGGMRVDEDVQLAVVAAAARADPAEWRTFLGGWLRDVGASIDTEEQAEDLEGWLDLLCDIEPELRSTTGRVRAAARLLLGQ